MLSQESSFPPSPPSPSPSPWVSHIKMPLLLELYYWVFRVLLLFLLLFSHYCCLMPRMPCHAIIYRPQMDERFELDAWLEGEYYCQEEPITLVTFIFLPHTYRYIFRVIFLFFSYFPFLSSIFSLFLHGHACHIVFFSFSLPYFHLSQDMLFFSHYFDDFHFSLFVGRYMSVIGLIFSFI